MTDEETDIIVTGGVVAGIYFLVVKPLLADFGLDSDQQAAVNSILNLQPQQNPFSPLFQPFVDFYINSNTGVPVQAWVDQVKANYDALDSADQQTYNFSSGGDIDIAKAAEIIYHSRGFAHNNFEGVIQVFASVPSKETVAAISAYLLYNYNVDLWQFLRNGKWYNISGMNAADITAIINRVMSLPDVV